VLWSFRLRSIRSIVDILLWPGGSEKSFKALLLICYRIDIPVGPNNGEGQSRAER
jgi:hypothetical protein